MQKEERKKNDKAIMKKIIKELRHEQRKNGYTSHGHI